MDTSSIIGTKNRKGQIITDPRVMMNEALVRRRSSLAVKSSRKPSDARTSM